MYPSDYSYVTPLWIGLFGETSYIEQVLDPADQNITGAYADDLSTQGFSSHLGVHGKLRFAVQNQQGW